MSRRLLDLRPGKKQCDGSAAPPDCARPIAGEEEHADSEDIVVCDAVVCVAQIDAGN